MPDQRRDGKKAKSKRHDANEYLKVTPFHTRFTHSDMNSLYCWHCSLHALQFFATNTLNIGLVSHLDRYHRSGTMTKTIASSLLLIFLARERVL